MKHGHKHNFLPLVSQWLSHPAAHLTEIALLIGGVVFILWLLARIGSMGLGRVNTPKPLYANAAGGNTGTVISLGIGVLAFLGYFAGAQTAFQPAIDQFVRTVGQIVGA